MRTPRTTDGWSRRSFGSKDGLVEEFLLDKDERIRARFEREIERIADTPKGRALAVFDVLVDAALAAQTDG